MYRCVLPSRPISQRLAALDDGFFGAAEEAEGYLRSAGLWVLETAEGRIVGCGIRERVVAGGDAFDIGMMVGPEFRRRGYGTFIASQLKYDLLAGGLRPVCGCAVDNLGSRRALENAGFAADHRMLRFAL